MRKKSIVELIDEENLEKALILREQYIENASLPQKTIIFMITKRIFAACLALLFLIIPASVFLLDKNTLPHHNYKPPDNVEYKNSFQEMNAILGSEHLYNRLSEEYTTLYRIMYRDQIGNSNTAMNMNWSNHFVIGELAEIQKIPLQAEIFQTYSNGDQLHLKLMFNVDECRFYTGDAYTEICGVTVHLDFMEDIQYARFFYQEHTYVLSLESENTDITHYLNILLEESQ